MGLWHDVFGESRREVWKRLAGEVGGVFVDGGLSGSDEVRARLGGFDIVLDQMSSGQPALVFTRMSAPFVNGAGLRFRIFRASLFSGLAKKLGQQDIEIGDGAFDSDWIIQGNDVDRIRAALSDPSVRALLAAQPKVRIEIADDEGLFGPKYGDDIDVLTLIEAGEAKDQQRLSMLFTLFAALLRAFGTGGSFVAVPPAELPAAFASMVAHLAEGYGGDVARVGDAIEARLEDPRVPGAARLTVGIPALPALVTSVHLEAPLLAGVRSIAPEKFRGATVVIGDDALVVDGTVDAAAAPALIGSALSLWSTLLEEPSP